MRISDWSSDVCSSDLILGVTWKGLDPQWPMRLTLDYVKNLGAEVEADTGYSADLSLGKASAPGDWRFTWGYAMAQTDAVLAAFSQDNLGLGTNYPVHALTVDYVPPPNTMLSAYSYHYKPYRPLYPPAPQPGARLAHLRLAFLAHFS